MCAETLGIGIRGYRKNCPWAEHISSLSERVVIKAALFQRRAMVLPASGPGCCKKFKIEKNKRISQLSKRKHVGVHLLRKVSKCGKNRYGSGRDSALHSGTGARKQRKW